MKALHFLGWALDLACRQACRACIERCHVVAGQFDYDESASAVFFRQ